MASTNPSNTIQREERDQRDQRDQRRVIPPEARVFGSPCQVNIDWNAAIHQQRLLATLPYPSWHERAYTKWLQGHRMEPAWTELNFLQRAEWVQFYLDTTTEDLKVTELDSKEIQEKAEAETKEYVQMAQRTIIPSMTQAAVAKSAPSMFQAPAVQSAPTMSQAPVYNQFGPPTRSAPSISQQTVYNQFGPPARSVPPMNQQVVYNQFPITGPVYMNQYRGSYQGPRQG